MRRYTLRTTPESKRLCVVSERKESNRLSATARTWSTLLGETSTWTKKKHFMHRQRSITNHSTGTIHKFEYNNNKNSSSTKRQRGNRVYLDMRELDLADKDWITEQRSCISGLCHRDCNTSGKESKTQQGVGERSKTKRTMKQVFAKNMKKHKRIRTPSGWYEWEAPVEDGRSYSNVRIQHTRDEGIGWR